MPALTNNTLPWLLVNGGFGVIVNGKLQATAADTPIGIAGSASNVLLTSDATLSSDKEINTLTYGERYNLDLGGHSLQLDSGGVMFAYGGTIKNGQLTVGPNSGNELVFHYVGEVDANIVDNSNGPVSVVVSNTTSSFGIYLGGSNTYSGTTYVNGGQLTLLGPAALPDGGNLEIAGGSVNFAFATTALKHLGSIRIDGSGSLSRNSNGTFSFDALELDDGIFQPGALVGSGPIHKRTVGSASIGVPTTGTTYNGDVYVEEGVLSANSLNQAKFHVSGGKLVVVEGGAPISLDGGAFEYLYNTSVINVTADSRIIAEPQGNARNYGLAGSFTGSGGLSFDNPFYFETNVANKYTGDIPAVINGHSPNYSGKVDIGTATVVLRNQDSLGSGDITIHAGGKLSIAFSQTGGPGPTPSLHNSVYLAGGELQGGDSSFVGNLYVSGNSFVSSIRLGGAVYLSDGSRLTTTDFNSTRFLGDTYVGGVAELDIGRTIVRSSALEANRGIVEVGGRLISNATQATLNLFNAGLDQLVFDAAIHVQAGQSLQILEDNVLNEITFGSGTSLTGSGTLLNPIRLEGGTLSPGQSPGQLNFGAGLTIATGSTYEWQINDALGVAGQPDGWDLVHVAQQLTFASTAANPWEFRIEGLNSLNQSGTVANFDPQGHYEWLVAMADSIVGFDPTTVRIDFDASAQANPTFRKPNFSWKLSGGNLFLVYNYRVPEPGSLILLMTACLTLLPALVQNARRVQ